MPVPRAAEPGQDLICGAVTVPLRHDQPDGPSIQLAVAVFGALDDRPAADPVVLLRGGPGESTLTVFSPVAASSIGATIRAHRDLVLIELRGTYYSTLSLSCPEWDAFMDHRLAALGSLDGETSDEIAAMQECRDRLVASGIELDAFNLLTTAATLVAQHLMAMPDHHLRSVVLDSPLPVSDQPYLDFVRGADHGLLGRLQVCREDAGCFDAFGDLRGKFQEAIDSLNARSAEVTVRDPHTGVRTSIVLTGDRLAELVYNLLSDTETIPVLPIVLQTISERDFSLVPTFAPALFHPPGFSRGLQYSALCPHEFNAPAGDIATSGDLGTFGVVVAATWPQRLHAGCAMWQVPSTNETDLPVTAAVPTLVVSGEFDILPASYGPTIADALPNGIAITVPAAAHTPSGAHDCAVQVVVRFLDEPNDLPETTCFSDTDVRFITEPFAKRILLSEPPLGRLAVVVLSVLVLTSLPIAWAVPRFRTRAKAGAPTGVRCAWPALVSASVLCIVFTATFFATNPLDLMYGFPLGFRLAMLLPVLSVPVAAASAVIMVAAWRAGIWGQWVRGYYSVATVSLSVFIWQLNWWHLLGLRPTG
jgi:hypothetical protein